MTFEEILDQAMAMLQRRGRLTYGTLKRQFQLDDAALEDLKNELIEGQRLAVDERGNVLVWIGAAGPTSPAPSPSATTQEHAPLTYTPSYLAEKILTSRSALEGERKQVTVLFADLKGSMELLADRDPEEARQLLDPVLERMMDAVHRYEGTVNQVMGDGIMALLGAPIAHEDHAVRACYAALAMQAAVRQYAAEVQRTKGVPLHMRVGLNSGEVVVRAVGSDLRMDYSAIGQTTHLAARMEQMAMPGSTLLTAETLRLVEGLVQVTALGPLPVKGLVKPVEVYELVGATAVRRRLQATAARGLTRFVGRQTELEALRQALERAGRGQGQLVAVVGEPGVGKSRLVYEFLHSHHTQDWRVLESASVSYGRATPYFPVIDLLKRYAHIEDGDDTRTVRAKLTGQVLTLDEALQETIPALLALLDALPTDSPFLQLDPSQRRQRTLTALKRVLLRESQVQPLLLVFEDLHWIDSETQALLDSLVESLPTARLLLLVNYRPEYQHGWGGKTYYMQLRLDPLPLASAEELLQMLLGNDPGLMPLKQLLIARTEGNPFFLEESVRALVETGVLIGEPGTYQLSSQVGAVPCGRPEVGHHRGLPPPIDIQVPATVQAVLTARIDRLPPEEKRLLQTAAVIGNEVPLPLLQTIAELPEEALYRGLAHLQAAEFLYETRLFPEQEYTFKHALTQEVAYGGLLQERRRTLHARLVEALEALASEPAPEQVERLAHHALRGEVWAKAVPYCQQAGARAHDRAAFREAVAAFEQALQALAHLPEDGDTRVLAIELRLALAHALRGEHGRSRHLMGEAATLARALDDRGRLGRVLAEMALALVITGDFDGAIAAGQEALALATALGDRALQGQASRRLGQAYNAIGAHGRAAELLRWSVEAADREAGTSSLASRIDARTALVLTLNELGAFAEGRRYGEEALRLATVEGRGNDPVNARSRLGRLYLAQGDLEHAIPVLEQGVALCRASGDWNQLRATVASLGYAYTLQGRLAEGSALLEEGIRVGIHIGGVGNHARWVAWLSEVCCLMGHGEEAWQHARQALDLARRLKARGDEALALHQLGVVQAHADPPDVAQAEAHYQQALALAEELGMRPLQAHCRLSLGTLDLKMGQPNRARSELSTAIDLYRAMDMTFWLPQAEAVLAQIE
jgi:class 3 adenylate cyclase/tetratricopeptide (TPR) repeat protein